MKRFCIGFDNLAYWCNFAFHPHDDIGLIILGWNSLIICPLWGNNYQTSPISACTLSPIQANSPIKIETKCSCLPSPSSIYFILLLHWSCWSVTGFPVIWVFLEANAKFSPMISYSTCTGGNQAFLWAIVYSYKRKNLRKKWYIKVTRWMTLVK